MKRLIGFLIGLTLSLALAYAVRRWLSTNATQPQPALPDSTPEPATLAPDAATERPASRFTVRTTGPRPQAPTAAEASVTTENEGRNAEPEAATNTDEAAASPRAEMTEPTVPTDTPVKAPKDTTTASEPADFTVITDVGPVFNQKLHDAGVKTFGELAALSPEEIEAKTDIPASRVERGNWVKQAARLAEGLSPEE